MLGKAGVQVVWVKGVGRRGVFSPAAAGRGRIPKKNLRRGPGRGRVGHRRLRGERGRAGAGSRRGGEGGRAQEKTSACAVSWALLRTRSVWWAPQGRVLNPTRAPRSRRVGLQAPASLLAPSGYSIGSSKVTPDHEHRRGLCRASARHRDDFTTRRGGGQEGRGDAGPRGCGRPGMSAGDARRPPRVPQSLHPGLYSCHP